MSWAPQLPHHKKEKSILESKSAFLLRIDPDVLFRKSGKTYEHLRDLFIDSHLSAVWDVRASGVQGQWELVWTEGASSEVQQFLESHMERWDIGALSVRILQAVLYGVQPLELMWQEEDGYWVLPSIQEVHPDHFEWSTRAWKFRAKRVAMPAGRFFFVRHKYSGENPYGEKLLSRVFWPVTLKRHGIRWWAEFIERFGSPLLVGKYPKNDSEEVQQHMLASLEQLLSSSVATVPEDTALEIVDAASRASAGTVHREFIEVMNAEISKTILGQTMTTEMGAHGGALASAKVHDVVRSDIAKSDRIFVASVMQHLISLLLRVNFKDPDIPQFRFVVKEDLQQARASRDEILFRMSGYRPTKAYFARYGFQADEIAPRESSRGESSQDESLQALHALQDEKAPRILEEAPVSPRGVLSKEWMNRKRQKQWQASWNKIIDACERALKKAESVEDALYAILEQYPDFDIEEVSAMLMNIRYVAAQEGAHHA